MKNQKSIEEMSIDELKVLAYDEGLKLDQARRNLEILQNKIIELYKKEELNNVENKKK